MSNSYSSTSTHHTNNATSSSTKQPSTDKPTYILIPKARAAAEAAKAMNKNRRAEILEEITQFQQTQHS